MIGAFRDRIAIERAADAPDGGGGFARQWAQIAQAWARIEPLDGVERAYEDARVRLARLRIAVRAEADVRAGDRLRWDGRLYGVTDVRAQDARGRILIIDAEGGEAP